VTSVSAYASQRPLQQSFPVVWTFSSADEPLPKNRKKTTFGPHGISLFTELEILFTFVHYSYSAE